MFKRNKLLCLLVLALLSSSLYWGCEQPEDVITPLSDTDIWLAEMKLPSNPDGMVYELWVADASDTISLGKFGYDFTLHRYLEVDGSVRADTNKFHLNFDALDFTSILMSVEAYPDDNTNSPGAIMLEGNLADQTVRMRFPKIDSLWESTIWYDMETPSDGLEPVTDGYGVWFCTYEQQEEDFNDTLSIEEWWVDTYPVGSAEPGFVDTVVVGIVEGSIETLTLEIYKGLDTVYKTVIDYEAIEEILTEEPYFTTNLSVRYQVVYGTILYDNFNQGETEDDPESQFGLPNLTDYGWKYKPWVISPRIDSTVITNRFTKPAWRTFSPWLDETEGAMLTTGTFAGSVGPDDADPYLVSNRRPPYPGEDFLANLPGGLSAINLVPNTNGNPGRVIISLEPVNSPTDTTNFPLVAFVGEFPDDRSVVTSGALQAFVLRGWFAQESDPEHGFPWIGVTLERY